MSHALISTYESASKIMTQMLGAARANAWEKVNELEESYLMRIEVIKQLEAEHKAQKITFTNDQLVQKQAIIQKILADDGEIRALLFPVMHKITDMIYDAQVSARFNQNKI